ncbi:hypothetical protein ACFO0O_17685 [Cobetia amphilecti]|uniref:Uncharacterized protein n=1 Tax=Cobetia amphilecti TaxID=1055104 RepID=A0ABT6UX27_9GAMM|nr:hypothetical protein [Cobetia amphilecti]MDI5886052.1 hypothetical protein [Cobetia amphilecti]
MAGFITKLFEKTLYKDFSDYLKNHEDEIINIEIIGNGTVILKDEARDSALSEIDHEKIERALKNSKRKIKRYNDRFSGTTAGSNA